MSFGACRRYKLTSSGLGTEMDSYCYEFAPSRSVSQGFIEFLVAAGAENGAKHSARPARVCTVYRARESRAVNIRTLGRPRCLSRRYQSLAHSSVEVYETHESNPRFSFCALRNLEPPFNDACMICTLPSQLGISVSEKESYI